MTPDNSNGGEIKKTNGWFEKFVEEKLKDIQKDIDKINSNVDELYDKIDIEIKGIRDCIEAFKKDYTQKTMNDATDIAQLKVKSGVWGLIGGAIVSVPATIIMLWQLLK